jgi:hypothetical protein
VAGSVRPAVRILGINREVTLRAAGLAVLKRFAEGRSGETVNGVVFGSGAGRGVRMPSGFAAVSADGRFRIGVSFRIVSGSPVLHVVCRFRQGNQNCVSVHLNAGNTQHYHGSAQTVVL